MCTLCTLITHTFAITNFSFFSFFAAYISKILRDINEDIQGGLQKMQKINKHRLQNQWIMNLWELEISERHSILQHLWLTCCKMQKYHKNRLLCRSNLTILLFERWQLLHLLWVTLYIKSLGRIYRTMQ